MKALFDAADYLRQHGWCQRAPSDSMGRVCLANAINHVTIGDQPAYRAASTRVAEYLGVASIAMWNDEVCKTQEQAAAVLIGAARMAQIGEPQRRYEVIPIHTPPVETPVEPKAPVVNPEKVEPEKVE